MLGDRLRELREESDLNQEEFAKRISISRAAYANYEVGRTEPSISILKEISNFYNVSIDYLCGNTNIRNNYYKDPKLCEYINRCLLIYKEFFDKKKP